MQYNLEIRPIAELDAYEVIDYYFAISVDLAYRFKDGLEAAYKK
jgi:hypothetical protein